MKKKRSDATSRMKRPKRHVLAKQQSSSSGLSWREETAIQKALYASLNETRRSKPLDDDSIDVFKTLSDQISMSLSRSKVHAQRKFAQGSNPSSPMPTPIKLRHSLSNCNAVDVLPVKKPKTEDFLTFLCLRGSPVLPPNMDYLSGNLNDEDRSSESRSATSSIIEKSENSSISGHDNSKFKDFPTSSSDITSIKKPVLQSPLKQNVFTKKDCLPIRQTRNSMIQKKIKPKQNITARLVEKARSCQEQNKSSSKEENQNHSRLSALKQKYKERRLETQKLAKKNLTKKSSSEEPRITRSKSAEKSKQSGHILKSTSRQRKAKLKPTIIEYASSDCDSDIFSLNDSNKDSKVPKHESDNNFEHSHNRKLLKTSDVPSAKKDGTSSTKKDGVSSSKKDGSSKKTNVKKPIVKDDILPKPRKSKSLTSAIMEAAGSDPLSSSSSSSSSDLETEIRVLRNSRKIISLKAKSSYLVQKAKVHSTNCLKTVKKNAVDRRNRERKMLKKVKKEKHERRLKLKQEKLSKKKKNLKLKKENLKSQSKSKNSLRKQERKEPIVVKPNSLKSNGRSLALRSSDQAVVSNKSKLKVPKALNKKDGVSPKQVKSSPICKRSFNDISSSSSSDSDSSDDKPLSSIKKPEKVIDIDSLIELSSSDDSLYAELMFLTKRASKELSPKTPSLNEIPSCSSNPGPSSNIQTSTTIARRSLSIENKIMSGSETTFRKAQWFESTSKTMCDASTNTCDDDLLKNTSTVNQGPTWMSVPPPKRISSSNSSTSPLKAIQPLENLPPCLGVRSITCNSSEPFPSTNLAKGKIIKAPVYYPSVDEFKDPLEYISRITPQAEQYGICTIIPPPSFKPECQVNDDMRFTSHNQHLHRIYKRWGPNVQQLACITKHLEGQGVSFDQAPLIGGIELDLCKLYETVQSMGGLKQVIEKNKWPKIADLLKIPQGIKLDRGNKLYDIYCKYLVSYDTLPKEEKQKLEQQVINAKDKKKNAAAFTTADAIIKGKSMALSQFYRIARHIMSMWYKSNPSASDVETNYWQIVEEGKNHVVVHAADIDSSVYKTGFPSSSRNSLFGKHPWNLKILTNNLNSILRCVGPVSGVTIPTLHLGMLYTTGCWYQDPHYLPWIEYLHTGAPKIWYGIPSHLNKKFKEVMHSKVPELCQAAPLLLPSDTAMIPPSILCESGVSISKITQEAGQFVVVFPQAFTSTIGCGYNISESVYFALPEWLDIAPRAFQDLNESCEPATFSLDKLLIGICNDSKVGSNVLKKVLPLVENLRDNETKLRKKLSELGLKASEHMPLLDLNSKKKVRLDEDEQQECFTCQALCHVSMVVNSQEECAFCLQHAIPHIQKKKNLKHCKLVYVYTEEDLNIMLRKVKNQLNNQTTKQLPRRPNK